MRRKSTCVFGAQVTFGIIVTTSPSRLFRNCSSLLCSLVILILNRWTLYFIFLPPSADRFSSWLAPLNVAAGQLRYGGARRALRHLANDSTSTPQKQLGGRFAVVAFARLPPPPGAVGRTRRQAWRWRPTGQTAGAGWRVGLWREESWGFARLFLVGRGLGAAVGHRRFLWVRFSHPTGVFFRAGFL